MATGSVGPLWVTVQYPLVNVYVWQGLGQEIAKPDIKQTLSHAAKEWISSHEGKEPMYGKAVYALPHKGILVGTSCYESFPASKIAPLKVRKRNSSKSNSDWLKSSKSSRLEEASRSWYVFVDSNDSTQPQRVAAIRHALHLSDALKISQFSWGELDPLQLFNDNYAIKRVDETKEGLEKRLAELMPKAA